MHLQPFFKEYKFFSLLEEGSLSEVIFNSGICLPSDTNMTNDDIKRIIDIIKGLFVK